MAFAKRPHNRCGPKGSEQSQDLQAEFTARLYPRSFKRHHFFELLNLPAKVQRRTLQRDSINVTRLDFQRALRALWPKSNHVTTFKADDETAALILAELTTQLVNRDG